LILQVRRLKGRLTMARKRPVVAIDGPVGSGKTTVARLVARKLGYVLADTGAIYRCLALAARREGVDWLNGSNLAALAASMSLNFVDDDDGQRVFLDGSEVTREIREPGISQGASKVSAHPEVRKALMGIQRQMGRNGGVVMEGRDIGTVVFPDAEIKAFISGSPEVRARRRFDELIARGVQVEYDETLREVIERDMRDEQRAVAPLKPAEDAEIIDTGPLTADQVADHIVSRVDSYLREVKN
jgi:CMP/dCMP kinase